MATLSLWADYHRERFNWETIEVEGGFISFNIKSPDISVEEFYVRPDLRGTSLAKRLADLAVKRAKEEGCTKLWAVVVPGVKGAEHAIKMYLHYGLKLMGNRGDDTILMLDLGGRNE